MIPSPKEVVRLAAQREAENLEFRRYLRQHHETDGLFYIVGQRVQAQVDCRQCGNCCEATRVTVSQGEIEAIAAFLAMPVEEVVRLYTEEDPRDHSRLLAQPKCGPCIFLDKGLCLIYEARPTVCREYPHLHTGHASLGSRLESMGRHASICPILFGTFEEMKHVVGYHAKHH